MDRSGVIIASTNPERLNAFHEGAAKVLASGQALEIGVAEASRLEGSRAGINLPITLDSQTVGVVGLTGEPSEIRQYGELVRNMVEVMVTQSLVSEQLQAVTDARRTLILNIVHGNLLDLDEDTVQIQGRLFGYDLSLPQFCIVFSFELGLRNPLEESKMTQYMTSVAAKLFGRDHVSAYLGGGYFVVLLPATGPGPNGQGDVRKMRELCRSVSDIPRGDLECSYFVGIGRYHESLRGLNYSYEDAMRALRIGKTLYKSPALRAAGFRERVYDLGSLGMYAVVASLPADLVKLLREHSVGTESLIDALGDTLTSTLVSFLIRNLNMQRTAESMHLHRNTLAYRLDRIRAIAGKDPRRFSEAVELCLVLFSELIDRPREA